MKNHEKKLGMNFPEIAKNIAETNEIKLSLKVPNYIIHGERQEEQEHDLLQGAVVQAYLRGEVTLRKAGQLLGFKNHEDVCKVFVSLNIPTIKTLPGCLETIQDKNRKYFESKIGV